MKHLEERNLGGDDVLLISYGDKLPKLIEEYDEKQAKAPNRRVEFDLMLGRN
jgi:hypothetical protein